MLFFLLRSGVNIYGNNMNGKNTKNAKNETKPAPREPPNRGTLAAAGSLCCKKLESRIAKTQTQNTTKWQNPLFYLFSTYCFFFLLGFCFSVVFLCEWKMEWCVKRIRPAQFICQIIWYMLDWNGLIQILSDLLFFFVGQKDEIDNVIRRV